MKIRCITEVRYDGITHKPGDVIDVTDGFASEIIHRNRAEKYIKPKTRDEVAVLAEGKRCVSVTGWAPTKHLTPWDDPNWEIWSMCHRPELYKRITRHVELHNLRKRSRNSPYFKWLVENQYKVVLAEPVPELPSAQIFPQAEVMSRFGGFYTNSVSWMISLALLENVDVIGLWGVDMAAGTEYEYQLPSALYHLGIAVGMGKEIVIPPYSKLMQQLTEPKTSGDQKLNTLFHLGVAYGQGVRFQVPESCELFRMDRFYWLI